MSTVNYEEQAARIWPVLVQCAKQTRSKSMTYTDVQRETGIYRRAQRTALGVIQSYCLDEKLPPLTILVVTKKLGRPGPGFIAWDIADYENGVEQVRNFDWASHGNPFAYAVGGDTKDSLARQLAKDPMRASDVYARVKVRGQAQAIFRKTLLITYQEACAFCGLSFVGALHAAHIVPWSECERADRMNPRNGILLCANHHELFDSHYFCITDGYRIEYCDPTGTNDGPYSDADKRLSLDLHGKSIRLPKQDLHRPASEFLSTRQKAYRRANR